MERKELIRQARLTKIAKTYAIAFTYSGIRQYADFREKEDGLLFNPTISVNYARNLDLPAFKENMTIQQVLDLIREKVDKNAAIYMINGMPVSYYENTNVRILTKKFHDNLEHFITVHVTEFFKKVIAPMMIVNGWVLTTSHIGMPVLAEKNEDGEWDNLKNKEKEFELEYICYQFIKSVEPNAKLSSRSEYGRDSADAFLYLQKYVPLELFKELGLYYAND